MIGKTHGDAELREGVRKQVVGAAVQSGGRDDVVAGLGNGLNRVADGRHARGHGQRGNAAFQLGHALFEHRVGRVHDAGVDVARDFEVEQVSAVLSVIKRIGDRLINRCGHGLGGGVGFLAAVNGNGFNFHGGFPGLDWRWKQSRAVYRRALKW